jgi:Ca2+-binding EF-hand superfamily protein
MIGSTYGAFLRNLLMTQVEMDMEYLDVAMSGLGCDEDLLVDVLCTSRRDDFIGIYEVCKKSSHHVVNMSKFVGKTRKDSPLQRFVKAIFESPRDADSAPVDHELARTQMEALHAVATRQQKDEGQYFNILSKASRSQCEAINAAYQSTHNFTLSQSINAVYRGAIARALSLWSMPVATARLEALNYSLNDKTYHDAESCLLSVVRIFASCEKDEIIALKSEYNKVYDDDLTEVISRISAGNLEYALYEWLNASSIDDSAEYKIRDYVSRNGGTVQSTFKDGHSISVMKGFLDEQLRALKAYAEKYKVSDIESQKVAQKPASANVAMAPSAPVTAKKFGAVRQPTSLVLLSQGRGDINEYASDFQMVSKYLRKRFLACDTDHSGTLDSTEFWNLVRSLNIGYSEEDIENTKELCDWDKDGTVSYDEIAVELSNAIINILKTLGKNVKIEMQRLMNESTNPRPAEHLPPSLVKYIRQSFDAYDLDKSGALDAREFWPFIKSIFNDVFCDDDLSNLQVYFHVSIFYAFVMRNYEILLFLVRLRCGQRRCYHVGRGDI